jgi:hypothetical protein
MTHKSKKLLNICLIATLTVTGACSHKKSTKHAEYEKVTLNASWNYNYESIKELSEKCDLAAYIKVTGSEIDESYKAYGVDLTIFTAEVKEALYGKSDKTIKIVMTGKVDEKEKKIYEIADDPLMNKGDEFFIFATANDNGTYTIMSGPQGRFEIKNGQVYSLNVSNEQVAKNNNSSNITVNKQSKEKFYKEVKEYTSQK